MLPKKLYVKNPLYLAAIWFILLFGTGLIIFAYAAIDEMLDYKLSNLDPSKRQKTEPIEYVIESALVVAYFAAVTFWRKATFRRKDFIRLAESAGMKFIRKGFHYSPIEVLDVYSFADGFLNNIYVVAKMDIPFFAFSPHPRVSMWKSPIKDGAIKTNTGGWTPDYMKEESRIELFSLISGPFNIDAEVKIENSKIEIPATGCAEIDSIVKEFFRSTNYFHAKLLFNTDCLRMTIIGGSWEGARFEEKIQKGFEIFQKLNDRLKTKYPVRDWKDWQVKWNKKDEIFYLEPGGSLS